MWYAVIEKSTGRLHSIGETLADPMPQKFEVQELGNNFNPRGKEWNPSSRTFVVETFNQRLIDAFFLAPGMEGLSSGHKQIVTSALEGLLNGEILS